MGSKIILSCWLPTYKRRLPYSVTVRILQPYTNKRLNLVLDYKAEELNLYALWLRVP